MRKTVALVRYKSGAKSLEHALSLCDGAADLKAHHKVLIKPNVVIGGRLFKNQKKGVVVNTEVLEELIIYLRDFGCTDISIGEGSLQLPQLGVTPETSFETAGITALAERYQVKLLNLYKYPFKLVELDGKKVEISAPVLEADYLINMPVLKTHSQTQVSLSLKNLKGSLNYPSKKNFHKYGLERYIALLNTYLRPHLNIVDGIYSSNKGPVSLDWQEVGVIIAGKDPLAVDIVGTKILGFEPSDIGHLREYAAITGQSLDIHDIAIKGESVESVKVSSVWDMPWNEIIDPFNVKGVTFTSSGLSTCSNCGFTMPRAIYMVFRELAGRSFTPVEIVVGDLDAIPEISQTVLLGDCAIKQNKHLEKALKISGCPPNIDEVYGMVKEYLNTQIVKVSES